MPRGVLRCYPKTVSVGPPDDNPTRSQRPRQGSIPTVGPTLSDASHPSSIHDSRFAAGTLLTERYRIVGRLGRGGMGEVYRADDLKLGQSVALKFLPERSADDPVWLRRLHDEVRIAREIAHPNVCRTYDIGEAEGEHFISMEYVDGEDLSSLLRRIGRFPTDKAVQVSRQLCAGIAAAHDKGVLHRDLKPANVMIDGRGRVRITDFGIAALADQMEHRSVQAGTPAYMAPEQLAGREVTERSDIYSLGLILYQIFTGREAFEAESLAQMQSLRETGPTTPSSHIPDMDPAAEQVILRCLRLDPQERPHSAIAVAAALPGGDPLAEALAAGETPSPAMVAESGRPGGLRPSVAVPCLIAMVLLTIVSIVIGGTGRSLLAYVRLDKPPAALADRARQIAIDVGYAAPPADEWGMFWTDDDYLEHIRSTDESVNRWARLSKGQPAALRFRHRSSPGPMVASGYGRITWNDPPFQVPGMIRTELDQKGRLLWLEAVPSGSSPDPGPASDVDWSLLFAAAGLDPAQFTSTASTWIPGVYCDTRAAWLGVWPDAPDATLRIEAGAVAGKPVLFRLISSWEKPDAGTDTMTTGDRIGTSIIVTLFTLIPVAAGLIAWRHLRAGRGDRRGATRLAMYAFGIGMGAWLFVADHVPVFDEMNLLTRAFGGAAGFALVCWVLYLAIEPYARRHWPHAIISWTRLLSGRIRDPLVGRDVLLGCLIAATILVVTGLAEHVMPLAGLPPWPPALAEAGLLTGGRHVIATLFEAQTGIGVFIGAFVLLLLLRILFRKPWLANGAFVALLLVLFTGGFTTDWVDWIVSAFVIVMILITMIRFGLLSLVVLSFAYPVLAIFPATFDLEHWYAGIGAIGPLAIVGLAAWGFWVSLAGRPIFRDELLGAPAIGRP